MTSTAGPRVRMSPDERREQLLEIGVRMLATRPLEDLSIELLAEQAGISRGLLYHYFANKQEFHRAVLQRAAQELYDLTAPRGLIDPIEQMVTSIGAYVDYVEANHDLYLTVVRAARGGDDDMREIYLGARNALTDRIFEIVGPEVLRDLGVVDTPGHRALARAWAAMTEELVLEWVADPELMSRDQLLSLLAGSLPAVGQLLAP